MRNLLNVEKKLEKTLHELCSIHAYIENLKIKSSIYSGSSGTLKKLENIFT